jgi:hypothetical protein
VATSAVTPPPGYSLEDASGAAPSTPNASGGAGITPPPGYSVSDGAPTGPGVTGEITNDVGNKVIVPKDGEDFGDTIKRAIAYHHSLTPQQQQEAQDKETATIPKKTAQTLAGAATAGVLGPALLAAPGEALLATHAAVSAGIDALVPALTSGTVAVGKWAAEHPIAAKAVFHTLKWAIQGVGYGAGVTAAGKIIGELLKRE